MSIKFCSSVLLVKDINVSRKFYEEYLQQKVKLNFGTCIEFTEGFSIWQMSYAYDLMFKESHHHKISDNKGHAFELYFETDNLDDIYAKLARLNIELVHDMFEQPWGQRVFRIYDPDKNIVELGEPMYAVIKRLFKSGMTLEKVSERTSMPLDIVKKAVESL